MKFREDDFICFRSKLPKGQPSNLRNSNLNDGQQDKQFQERSKKFAKRQINDADENETDAKKIFKRGMCEKDVKLELFIIETDDEFEEKPLKSKMVYVLKKCVNELKRLFYELGVESKLPSDWDAFKEFVIGFCTNKSIYDLRKYEDEVWSEYVLRITEWARNRNFSEDVVLSKMRSEKLPQTLQYLFYSTGITLSVATERIMEWEKFTKNPKIDVIKNRLKSFEAEPVQNKAVKCFYCKKRPYKKQLL
jgi:hypothetical protein